MTLDKKILNELKKKGVEVPYYCIKCKYSILNDDETPWCSKRNHPIIKCKDYTE